jgi:hypothetical protein
MYLVAAVQSLMVVVGQKCFIHFRVLSDALSLFQAQMFIAVCDIRGPVVQVSLSLPYHPAYF